MSLPFVFVHGWGTGPEIWNSLIECLHNVSSHSVNLGFTGNKSQHHKGPAIYITHSLGTMWALKQHDADIRALVTINGFACFQNFTNKKVLRAMQLRLKKEPQEQMKDFWDMCDLPGNKDLNIQKLHEGLKWLASWDESKKLKTLRCPVLALAGGNDPILPLQTMQEEWAGFDLQIQQQGGHALPISHPKWCAEQIKEVVSDL